MDFGFLNARVRARRARLLGGSVLDALVEAPGLDALIALLGGSPYGPHLASAMARYGDPSEALDAALRAMLSDDLAVLDRDAPAGARPCIGALLSFREAANLKTIARVLVKGGERAAAARLLVPAGSLDDRALRRLLGAGDLDDMAALLSSWGSPYARPFRAGLEAFARTGSLFDLERELDAFVLSRARAATARAAGALEEARATVEYLIDKTNIMTLVKLCGETRGRELAVSLFVEGGKRLLRGDYEELAAETRRDRLLDGLASRVSDRHMRAVLDTAYGEEAIFLEERLDALLAWRLDRASVVDPLGIAVPYAYMYARTRELKNLRLIARAKIFAMPARQLRRALGVADWRAV